MTTLKKVFTNWRVIIVLAFLAIAILAISPQPFQKGVAVRSVAQNSTAALAGMTSPKPTTSPTGREVINSIDNIPIKNIDDYNQAISSLVPNSVVTIDTDKGTYTLQVQNSTNLGLTVYNAPVNNLRKGLELEGGTRVLLQPENKLSPDEMATLIGIMTERLNVYGLSDLIIRPAEDLPPPIGTGNQYIVVEIAGASQQEVRDLLAKQGKFEAKIGNNSVFKGGQDIRSVCKSAECAGIDPSGGCGQDGSSQWICRFRFSISLSQDAASRQAEYTKDLEVVSQGGEPYLSQKLILYLDDQQVDELNIAADLKGKAVTDIQIQGSGAGINREDAMQNALDNMKRLQTILQTGSLPVKIQIVKMDTISASLGGEFIRNAIMIGVLSFIAVAVVVYTRYRRLKISATIMVTMLSEILLILGIAAFFKQNLDLASIAGIIVTVGTGVNDQIVITDEALRGSKEKKIYDWKERISKAFFIIMAAYATTVVTLFPLIFTGAGLLRGFAITTIMGVSVGVFITRPAFAAIVELMLKD